MFRLSLAGDSSLVLEPLRPTWVVSFSCNYPPQEIVILTLLKCVIHITGTVADSRSAKKGSYYSACGSRRSWPRGDWSSSSYVHHVLQTVADLLF